MNQKLLTLHTLTPQAFLIAIAVALAACFSGVAWAGDASASDARTLTAKSDTTPIYLEIAPRRQWDCNYGMNGLSPCKCPGNPNDKNFADTDTYGCWDSCLDSPEPDQPGDDSSDSYLSVSDCHCGEGQATLAGLCTKRAGARACRVKAKRGPGLNGNFKDASSSTPQLPNCSGFCGANSIQQAALYQGAYVSQGLIRLLGKGNDPPHDDNAYTALQLLIDQDRGKRDVHDVVDTLGFKTDRWYPESEKHPKESICSHPKQRTNDSQSTYGVSNQGFVDWVEDNLDEWNPTITALLIGGVHHDGYGHIAPIVGMEWVKPGNKDVKNARLIINDNYSSKPNRIPARGVDGSDGDCADGDKWCLALGACDEGNKNTGWGVAVGPPKNTKYTSDYAVHINVKGCEDGLPCKLNGHEIADESKEGGPAGWMEPNYTVLQLDAEKFELTATVERRPGASQSAPDMKDLRLARFRTLFDTRLESADAIRATHGDKTGPFHAQADKCFPVEENIPIDVGWVWSHESAFFRLVKAGHEATEAGCSNENPDHPPKPVPSVACSVFPRDASLCKKSGASKLVVKASTKKRKFSSLYFNMKQLRVHSEDHTDSHDHHTTIGHFGDPKNTDDKTAYRFCLYSGTGSPEAEMATLIAEAEIPTGADASHKGRSNAESQGNSAGKSSWKRLPGSNGFKFSTRTGEPDGVQSLWLKMRGTRTKPEIRLRAMGSALSKRTSRACRGCPSLPIENGARNATTTAQVVNSRGACWSASFSNPSKNNAGTYRATSSD